MTPRLATSISTHSYYRRVFMLRGNKRNFKSKNRVIEKKNTTQEQKQTVRRQLCQQQLFMLMPYWKQIKGVTVTANENKGATMAKLLLQLNEYISHTVSPIGVPLKSFFSLKECCKHKFKSILMLKKKRRIFASTLKCQNFSSFHIIISHGTTFYSLLDFIH